MNKKIKGAIVFLLIVLMGIFSLIFLLKNEEEIKSIKSEKQLLKIYKKDDYSTAKEVIINILCMPFSIGEVMTRGRSFND